LHFHHRHQLVETLETKINTILLDLCNIIISSIERGDSSR
jgi:hypothetical protein